MVKIRRFLLSSSNVWIRHCEFARAAAECILDKTLPQLRYIGFVKKEFLAKVQEAISATVYQHWDDSTESGPKTRPQEAESSEPLGFKVLSMSANGDITWPDSVTTRFPPDTSEFKALDARRQKFLELCPAHGTPAQVGEASVSRSSARPDYSIDNGAEPLDTTRLLDLPGVPSAEFTAQRQGR